MEYEYTEHRNPTALVQIEDTGTGIVRIFFYDENKEIIGAFTFDDLDNTIGCGNAFGLGYQYLLSLQTRGYEGTIEAFGLQNNPGGAVLPDELTVDDILNWE